jgi:hypothetical protein
MIPEKYINPFTDLFETAEIAKFSSAEKVLYEDSLKSYRDLKNVIDTSFGEGELAEKIKGIVKAIKRAKLSIEEIAEDFETTVEFVLKIRSDYNL